VGWLYGGVIGAVVFKLLHDYLSALTPQYWQGLIGIVLVVLVLVGRERLSRGVRALVPARWRDEGRA
jgi:branched-chain amino acid transport system permease protein